MKEVSCKGRSDEGPQRLPMNVVMWPWGQGPQQVIPLVGLYSVSQREKQRRLQGSREQRVRMDDLASKKIKFKSWFYLSLAG